MKAEIDMKYLKEMMSNVFSYIQAFSLSYDKKIKHLKELINILAIICILQFMLTITVILMVFKLRGYF